MIRSYKYSAGWELVRNGFKFRRCIESGERIWPLQRIYRGISNIQWPCPIIWIKPDWYLLLKLKGEI